MAGPIPAAYITGFNAGYPLFYAVRINISGGDTLTVLSRNGIALSYGGIGLSPDYNFVGGNQSGAYIAAFIDDQEVEGIGEIDYQMELQSGGGLASTNETRVLFLNHSRFDDFISQFDYEHKQIEIWEGYDPPSHVVAIDTDMLLKFRGVVQDAGDFDYEQFTIPCVDLQTVYARNIPLKKITSVTFPDAPEQSRDKVLPIQIGLFDSSRNDIWSRNGVKKRLMPTIQTDDFQSTRDDPMRFYFSDHPNKELSDVIYSDETYYGKFTGAVIAADKSYADIADRVVELYLRPTVVGIDSTAGIDVTNLTDDDEANIVHIPNGSKISVRLDRNSGVGDIIPEAYPGIGYDGDFTIYIYVDVVGTPHLRTYFISTGTEVTTSPVPNTLVSGQNIFILQLAHPDGSINWDRLFDTEFVITCTDGGTECDIKYLKLVVKTNLQTFKTVSYLNPATPAMNHTERRPPPGWGNYTWGAEQRIVAASHLSLDNVFGWGKGAMYGAWGGSSNGSAIEHPAAAIEYILREKLGVTLIDSTNFALADSYRQGWYINARILEQQSAFEVIRRICFEFGLKCIKSRTGQFKIVRLDDGTTDYTITSSDIIYDGDKPQIRVGRTPMSSILNDFYFSFDFDTFTNKAQQSIYVSDVNATGTNETNHVIDNSALRGTSYVNWTNESITRYGRRPPSVESLIYIADYSTAVFSMRKLSDWTSFKRMTVAMLLKRSLDTLQLEIGDRIKINHELLGTMHQNTVNFMITRINYPPLTGGVSQPTIQVECEEIPNQYTGMTQIRRLSDEMWGR